MRRVLLVFGTRPEAIKLAPVYLELKKRRAAFETLVCVTGQHRQMLDQVLQLFRITPDVDLNVMRPGQDLFDTTSAILSGMRDVLRKAGSDVCLVQGDTTTTLAASLAAYYEQIPVGHVEAGLRTYQRYAPFPEELNRQLVSRLATYHFAPTAANVANLCAEGIPRSAILQSGNTVIDALRLVSDAIDENPERRAGLMRELERAGIDARRRPLILVTGHRRESFGRGFVEICRALATLARGLPRGQIVYPVHLNPNVQQPVHAWLGGIDNVVLCPPLDYEPFIALMKESTVILTDSGGIQEEGPSLGKPVLVMRETTERPEAIQAGTARLVGTTADVIVQTTLAVLRDEALYAQMAQAANPYGDGHASSRIVDFLEARVAVPVAMSGDGPA